MKLVEALRGQEIPEDIQKALVLVDVPYLSFGGVLEHGQLVVHRELARDVKEIFTLLWEHKFPIEKVVPIVRYNWDDNSSMADNNTSAFNYRVIAGTERLSNHSFGRAIDVNPLLNPYTGRDGKVVPLGARYEPNTPGTITQDIANIFLKRGWQWGGNWEFKDWQHFEKL